MQVRVMAFGLRNVRNLVQTGNGFDEILEADLAADPSAIVGQRPEGQRGNLSSGVVQRAGIDPTFTRETFFLG
jgi:hypothetical protein